MLSPCSSRFADTAAHIPGKGALADFFAPLSEPPRDPRGKGG